MKSVRFCNLLTQQASTEKKIQSQVPVEISCCYKINYCWWFKALSEISKSQIRVFVWNKFRIEEFMDLELRVITWVSTKKGSISFRVKYIVNTSILFRKLFLENCLGWILPKFFTFKLDGFISFPRSSYRMCSLIFLIMWYDWCVFVMGLFEIVGWAATLRPIGFG